MSECGGVGWGCQYFLYGMIEKNVYKISIESSASDKFEDLVGCIQADKADSKPWPIVR